MKKIIGTKKHILVKRFKLIKFLISEGYNEGEIGEIFNINRSTVSRIIATGEKYKGIVKSVLSNKGR